MNKSLCYIFKNELTAHTRTDRVEVDERLAESESIEEIKTVKLGEPRDEEDSEKDDVSQRQRRQIVTRTAQFVRLRS